MLGLVCLFIFGSFHLVSLFCLAQSDERGIERFGADDLFREETRYDTRESR